MTRDLSRYFARIGFGAEARTDLETLRSLHLAHPLAIPFENLSTLVGEPVPIDVDSIALKLVDSGRGGYCFEHNTLLQSVLEEIGFDVTALAARVVWNQSGGYVNPRTHMVLRVELEGREWLCDVGFGGATLTAPLELVLDSEQSTPHETFRLVRHEDELELQVLWEHRWRSMYRFDRQRQLPVDFEALNHYVATHPTSHFRTTLMAARVRMDRRMALVDNRLTVFQKGCAIEERTLDSGAAIMWALVEEFGIDCRRIGSLVDRLDAVVENGRD